MTVQVASPPSQPWTVQLLPVASAEVPGPEVFWMKDFDRWYPITCHVALLRSATHTVLVNAGLPDPPYDFDEPAVRSLGERARFVPHPPLLEQLSELGVQPTDVTHVVVTPLQWYTTGQVPSLVNAQVCLANRGWVHFHTTHDHPHDVRSSSLPTDVLTYLVVDNFDRVRLLADEEELLPGLRTWWAGGHHRASLVVEADTARGTVAITDAAFHLANVEQNIPLGINESLAEIETAYRRLRTADLLLPLYEPGLLDRYPSGVVA